MWRTSGYPSSSPSPHRIPSAAAYMAQQHGPGMVPPSHHMTAGPTAGGQAYMTHGPPQSHHLPQKTRLQQSDMYPLPPHIQQQHPQQQMHFHQVWLFPNFKNTIHNQSLFLREITNLKMEYFTVMKIRAVCIPAADGSRISVSSGYDAIRPASHGTTWSATYASSRHGPVQWSDDGT